MGNLGRGGLDEEPPGDGRAGFQVVVVVLGPGV